MVNTNVNNKYGLQEIKESFIILNKEMLNAGYSIHALQSTNKNKNKPGKTKFISCFIITLLAIVLPLFNEFSIFDTITAHILGTRCIVPNNYFVWEATRPISNCQFCLNVSRPIILPNITREQFAAYAYSSKPIIIKNAVKHWAAIKHFNFNYLKELYDSTEGAYESVEEDCQFLHFHSDFTTLRDVFSMSESRAKFLEGEKSWYVGW